MNPVTRVQTPDDIVYILHSVNTPWKDMNPTILSPAKGK